MQPQLLKSIALYGGAFDPPHCGHIALLNNLSTVPFLDQVWVLPCGDREDKHLLLSAEHRFRLLSTLLNKYFPLSSKPTIKVSDQQLVLSRSQSRMIPTIELLQYLQTKYPSHQFHFVIGADILSTIHTWHRYEQLIKIGKFIIYPREGYEQENERVQGWRSEFRAPEVSSSWVKRVLRDGNLTAGEKVGKIGAVLDGECVEMLKEVGVL